MIQNIFFIVRHGESKNNVLNIESSKLENKDQFGLTNKGKRTTQEEANKFNDIDLIFTSPFRRAKETAAFFAKTSNCKLIEDIRLRETDVGNFELSNYENVDRFMKKNTEDTPFPNGESPLEVDKRVLEFFKEINQTYNNKKILIVGHGGTIKTIIQYVYKHFSRKEHDASYNHGRKVFRIKPPY